jgi:2-octaprenylphenol hydroxylase
MSKDLFEVIIVGGGIVGATAACILAQNEINVALLDRHNPERSWPPEPIDIRVSALTKASQNILQQVGVWQAMEKRGVSAYNQMHVWDTGANGELHFDSADTEFDQLGHIVENRVTIAALWDLLDTLPHARCLCPAQVEDMLLTDNSRRLVLKDGRHLDSKLIIAADGRDSSLRTLAGIEVTGWPYKQDGLVATVSTEHKHHATARQRFLTEGPLAFLPLNNGQCSIVWTLSTDTAKQHLTLSDEAFLLELEQASGGMLGEMLTIGPRASFPLRFQYAKRYVTENFALIGDAAHAMHPLAGQGANAGLLDAAAIAEVIINAVKSGRPLGSHSVLRRYERWRKGDNLLMMTSMDMLNKIFGNSHSPLIQLRSMGMNWINHTRPIKNLFNHHAMGLREDLPRLAKGLNL